MDKWRSIMGGSAMKTNTLGKTGIRLTEMGLGTWELSGDVYGPKDDAESVRALHGGLDAGVNYLDTAAGYGKGHAEELVGRVLKERKRDRDSIVVSTKVLPQSGIFAPSPEHQIDQSYAPDWIVAQCDASLRRLQLDRIGILFLHTWSRSWGHRTEWYETLSKLKRQGKIRAFGISIPDEGIADANVHIEADRVDVIMCVYNIFQQEPEYTLFPLARKHKVGIIARSPFSAGALIGNWTPDITFPEGDWRGRWPAGLGLTNWAQNQSRMADEVRPIIEREGLSMPIAALRYALQNPDVTSVIPGSANAEHVKSNLAAITAPSLSPEAVQALKELWATGKIHGTYNGSI
jgi:aryl-alcohol dehydrogenase-like predicted oxidoreductase